MIYLYDIIIAAIFKIFFSSKHNSIHSNIILIENDIILISKIHGISITH